MANSIAEKLCYIYLSIYAYLFFQSICIYLCIYTYVPYIQINLSKDLEQLLTCSDMICDESAFSILPAGSGGLKLLSGPLVSVESAHQGNIWSRARDPAGRPRAAVVSSGKRWSLTQK